jgi:hypothetical protein
MSPNSNQASAADGSTILTDLANSEGSTAEEDVEERDPEKPSLSPPSSSVSEHVMSSDEEMDEDNQSTAVTATAPVRSRTVGSIISQERQARKILFSLAQVTGMIFIIASAGAIRFRIPSPIAVRPWRGWVMTEF